jgi:hypothetical protein
MEAPVLLALPLLLEGAFVVVVEGAGAEGRELLDWEAVWDEVWDELCDWACPVGVSIPATASAPNRALPRKKLLRLPRVCPDATLQLPTIRNPAPLELPEI